MNTVLWYDMICRWVPYLARKKNINEWLCLPCDPSVGKADTGVQKMNGWFWPAFLVNMYKIKSETIFSEALAATGWRWGHPVWSAEAATCVCVCAPSTSALALITEHLLRGAALLLQASGLVLDSPSRLLALRLHVWTLLSTFPHGGDLVAFSCHHWPPG